MFEIKFGKFFVLLLFIIGLNTITTFSQAAIKTENGYLFIKNGKDKSFTIEITGKEVTSVKSPNPTFLVDGRIVQILSVPLTNFTNKKMSDEELLEAHKIWETDYLGDEVFKKKLTVETEKVSNADRKLLFWYFTRPNVIKQYDRDVYMTTIIGNSLLGVSSPIEPAVKIADVQKLFLDIMKSLKVSDKPFDIAKLAEDIKKVTTAKKPN
jgi:hypothetical protein